MKTIYWVSLLTIAFGISVTSCTEENNLVPDRDKAPMTATLKDAVEKPQEVIPWGVTRVGGGTPQFVNKAWIIDSGIELSHPDLNVDVANSISFLKDDPSPNDELGHGTHIAGIIGAIKGNGIGVVGVAAGTSVVSVRVFDQMGNGTIAGMVAGINYAAAHASREDVVVICFEVERSAEIDSAVSCAAKRGIRLVIAAGNHAAQVKWSPAHLHGENIYTISAMDKNDRFAPFSNFGKEIIEYCAPGVEILSTDLHGSYSMKSGTSAAAPHVAGLLLLGDIHKSGFVSGDPDGREDAIPYH